MIFGAIRDSDALCHGAISFLAVDVNGRRPFKDGPVRLTFRSPSNLRSTFAADKATWPPLGKQVAWLRINPGSH